MVTFEVITSDKGLKAQNGTPSLIALSVSRRDATVSPVEKCVAPRCATRYDHLMPEPTPRQSRASTSMCPSARRSASIALFSEASSGELINRYVNALQRELEIVANDLRPRTIFFEGHAVVAESPPVGVASSNHGAPWFARERKSSR